MDFMIFRELPVSKAQYLYEQAEKILESKQEASKHLGALAMFL